MTIWKRDVSIDQLNQTSHQTMIAHLGITYTHITPDSLIGTMPVDERTHQPLGMLHGGASVVLAESLASLAANLCVSEDQYCVGLEINANHIRAKRTGIVTGKASPIHIGATTQVWQIIITDERDRQICISRLTVAVLKKK